MSTACERCAGSGEIARRTSYPCSYVGPGPVPDDARGICPARCDECFGSGESDDKAIELAEASQ